jgi:hypothetical protein
VGSGRVTRSALVVAIREAVSHARNASTASARTFWWGRVHALRADLRALPSRAEEVERCIQGMLRDANERRV